MTPQEMRSAVMRQLALDGVKKRHAGKTPAQITRHYRKLRKGKKRGVDSRVK